MSALVVDRVVLVYRVWAVKPTQASGRILQRPFDIADIDFWSSRSRAPFDDACLDCGGAFVQYAEPAPEPPMPQYIYFKCRRCGVEYDKDWMGNLVRRDVR